MLSMKGMVFNLSKDLAKVHSIETFGAVDGPGIRFVIFLQGCPMRCLYCHNPDTWDITSSQEKSVEQLITEIKKYRHYFGKNGGVTVSGGEPLCQIDFVIELFKRLKQENIHTCLDTSGILFNTTAINKFEKLLNVTDLVLLDIKHINPNKHKLLTGHSNENVLDFAKFLSKNHTPVWIRYVLVPTINEDENTLKELKLFLNTLSNIEKIEVLPYHTLGVNKYQQLGLDYPLKDISPPTSEQIELANNILKGDNK